MKGQMRIYYDEEGDFLEIGIGEPTECYTDEVNSGIFIRKDEKTHEINSIGILGFKKRSKSIKDFVLKLPVDISITA